MFRMALIPNQLLNISYCDSLCVMPEVNLKFYIGVKEKGFKVATKTLNTISMAALFFLP